MEITESVKLIKKRCSYNIELNNNRVIIQTAKHLFLLCVLFKNITVASLYFYINYFKMRPRRIQQSHKILEQPEQELSNLVEPVRSHSVKDFYGQIRGLRKSLKYLQALSYKNQGKIESIQNLIKDTQKAVNKKTQGSTSGFSKQDNYEVQIGENRRKLKSIGHTHKLNGHYLQRSSKQLQYTISNKHSKLNSRPSQSIGIRRSETIRTQRNRYKPNVQLQFDDRNSYGLYSSDRSNQPILKNTIELKELKSTPRIILDTPQKKLNWIRENVIGFNTCYVSPFDLELEAVYVDHTATNRPFQTIENMVSYAKLHAANPHTQYSTFGKFSTGLMRYAQQSLLKSLKANPSQYIAIPTGSGSTGALKHAIQILHGLGMCKSKELTTIFITPYEHHSNILPWVEMCQNVQLLVNDENNSLVMTLVREQLLRHPSNFLIISVSAASNVTSKLTNLLELNSIIKHVKQITGKTVIFNVDCAAYCCHHQLDVQQLDQLDFACISPHKNLGGAETCGVLLMRKQLAGNKPSFPGGGTVQFVGGYSKSQISYDHDEFAREIAGTPPWFAFYRAALSFELLNNTIGYDFIHEQEKRNTVLFFTLIQETNERLKQQGLNAQIKIYGEQNLQVRANVVSFNIVNHQGEAIVYYNHVCAALADIFGIQVRSGCFCAGPYGIQLLNLQEKQIKQIKGEIRQGNNIVKPGFVRLDLAFYLKQFQVKYIVKSLFYLIKYIKNVESLYLIEQSGVVTPRSSFRNNKNPQYQLEYAFEIQKQVQVHNFTNKNKLLMRKQTLQTQLKIGKSICRHPWDYRN